MKVRQQTEIWPQSKPSSQISEMKHKNWKSCPWFWSKQNWATCIIYKHRETTSALYLSHQLPPLNLLRCCLAWVLFDQKLQETFGLSLNIYKHTKRILCWHIWTWQWDSMHTTVLFIQNDNKISCSWPFRWTVILKLQM